MATTDFPPDSQVKGGGEKRQVSALEDREPLVHVGERPLAPAEQMFAIFAISVLASRAGLRTPPAFGSRAEPWIKDFALLALKARRGPTFRPRSRAQTPTFFRRRDSVSLDRFLPLSGEVPAPCISVGLRRLVRFAGPFPAVER